MPVRQPVLDTKCKHSNSSVNMANMILKGKIKQKSSTTTTTAKSANCKSASLPKKCKPIFKHVFKINHRINHRRKKKKNSLLQVTITTTTTEMQT